MYARLDSSSLAKQSRPLFYVAPPFTFSPPDDLGVCPASSSLTLSPFSLSSFSTLGKERCTPPPPSSFLPYPALPYTLPGFVQHTAIANTHSLPPVMDYASKERRSAGVKVGVGEAQYLLKPPPSRNKQKRESPLGLHVLGTPSTPERSPPLNMASQKNPCTPPPPTTRNSVPKAMANKGPLVMPQHVKG
ncbi:hypothetical protein CEXT_763661 [Caerostris extrusa]|uniref:Uncharacterized protein n=1 Tax=Caerostris extrusa TaxID=172846 RepID=A0AAV4WAE0_CAEEX|nr:hypothetical protein CEXT_763661 [Caerostris extrusa]